MRRRASAATTDDATALRFAWWAAFFATLTLVAALGIAKSAEALTVPSNDPPGVVVAPPTLPADEESAGEETETGEDEGFEECETGEECEEEGGGRAEAPAECLLSSAEATVTATAGKDRVRLQIRYTTSVPTTVVVEYGLHGSKGSLFLGSEKKQVDRRGVLHLTRTMTAAQMAKVMAARGFTVRLRVPAAPGSCKPFFDRQLDSRRATPTGLVWQQTG